MIGRLKSLLVEFPGESEVYLHLGQQILQLPPEFTVDVEAGLVGELRVLLGHESIVV